MIDYADECEWVPLGDERPQARKEHRCSECGRTIQPGETYRKVTGISEGDFYASKMCAHCEAAAQWLVATCTGYVLAAVLEDLREHWDESLNLRTLTLGRLIVSMRRRWRTRAGELLPVPDRDEIRASTAKVAA